MISGLNICMHCSKTNGQSDSSKIQCYYCSSVTCLLVMPAKANHDRGMDGQTMDEMILTLVAHNNKNDIIIIILSIRIDIL